MSVDMTQVLRILTCRGIDLWLDAGQVRARSRQGLMPADMVRFIRHFKQQIVAELQERERLEETAANILALRPEERAQYERELAEAREGDPHIMFDRRAYRLALAWLAEGSNVA